MITFLGYIFLYLIIGVVVLPFFVIAYFVDPPSDPAGKLSKKRLVILATTLWPLVLPFSLFVIFFMGWEELKNYK